MKYVGFLLLLLSSHCLAEGMRPIPAPQRYCAKGEFDICYEWALAKAPHIRIVAQGFADGIEYIFFRRSPSGRYRHLFHFQPVIAQVSAKSRYFWGYPWDIRDISVGQGRSVQLKATFQHEFEPEEELPAEQVSFPAVLFSGTTTQPDMVVPTLPFKTFSLESLAKATVANKRRIESPKKQGD